MSTGAIGAWRERGRFLDVGGNEIFVVEEGSGPDVLLCHGFPSSSFDWRAVIPRLAERAHVVSFDFLGYGLSDKPFDASFSLFDQADLAQSVARACGIERCTLVAHDMGDTVAAEMLMRSVEGSQPLGIDRAILFNGSIFMHLVQLSLGQQALLALPNEPLADRLPLEAFAPGIRETFSREHQPPDEEVDAMLALLRENGGDRLLPILIRYIEERRANQDRWTRGLVEYAGPLTAAWGEQDPIAVKAMPHHLAEIRPDTEVITWPEVGHWPPIEVPDRVAQVILSRLG